MTEFNPHELTGEGVIVVDGQNVETFYYWLTVVAEPGPIVAEGAISGSEAVLKTLRGAVRPQLALENGPTLAIQCEGGHHGSRWIKALRD